MNTNLIMLIEDNPDDVILTKRALRQSAIINPLFVAADGQEALDYLLKSPRSSTEADNPLPILIMLDLYLPKVDGLEVLRQIRNNERTRSIPVIILTLSNLDNDRLSSIILGAKSFLRKPIKTETFVKVITELKLNLLVLNEAAIATK